MEFPENSRDFHTCMLILWRVRFSDIEFCEESIFPISNFEKNFVKCPKTDSISSLDRPLMKISLKNTLSFFNYIFFYKSSYLFKRNLMMMAKVMPTTFSYFFYMILLYKKSLIGRHYGSKFFNPNNFLFYQSILRNFHSWFIFDRKSFLTEWN